MVAYTTHCKPIKTGIKTGYLKNFTVHCHLKIQPLIFLEVWATANEINYTGGKEQSFSDLSSDLYNCNSAP